MQVDPNDRVVSFRLGARDHERLVARAAAAGCSVSELLRRLTAARPEVPDVMRVRTATVTCAPSGAVVWHDGSVGATWPTPTTSG